MNKEKFIESFNPATTPALSDALLAVARFAKIDNAEHLVADMLLLLNQQPELFECTPATVLGAFMATANLGISLNPAIGYAYVVPHSLWKDGQEIGKSAQLYISYKGFLKKLYECNPHLHVDFECVLTGERFEIQKGTTVGVFHILNRNRQPNYHTIEGVYAVVRNKQTGATLSAVYLSKSEIELLRLSNPVQKKAVTPVKAWAFYKSMAFAKLAKQICKFMNQQNIETIDETITTFGDNGIVQQQPAFEIARIEQIEETRLSIEQLANCQTPNDFIEKITPIKKEFIAQYGEKAFEPIQTRAGVIYRALQQREKEAVSQIDTTNTNNNA